MNARHVSPDEFDYVVVGAGSAGCVVAARLSESGAHRVLLLEAGGDDNHFWVSVPLGSGKLHEDPRFTWQYEIEPGQARGSKKRVQPRGKLLGGTSSINGLVYMRGQRADFDHWRQLGNIGWSYDDVLPFFKKSEDNVRGASAFHGVGGPMTVSDVPHHPVFDAFLNAAEQAGYRRTDDFNGESQDGFGYSQLNTRNGRRCSTSVAYLRPAKGRKNLDIVTDAVVMRIVVQNGVAVGVEYRRNGQLRMVHAAREVVVCCGAFNTPQLMQVSGLGPGDLLRQHGIAVVADLPGVGANLDDHFSVQIVYRAAKPVTLNDIVNSPWRRWAMGLNYVLFRKGWMATNGNVCNGFFRSDPSMTSPDLRIHFCLWNRSGAEKLGTFRKNMGLEAGSSFHINLNLLHPESRGGSVRIKSPDIGVAPDIRFGHVFGERDQRAVTVGMRAVRKLMGMPAMAAYVAAETTPGSASETDEQLGEFCRKNGGPVMHSTSSCRMGVDGGAVVDPRLRVRGLQRLRIADASIMPALVGGNTNAATIMIGEKAASMILEDVRI